MTGYARRFAYNTGTADAYYLSKQLYNIVNKGAGINSNKAQRVINFLQKYGIKNKVEIISTKPNLENLSKIRGYATNRRPILLLKALNHARLL
mgnify:CR=1 FL=1